MSAFLWLLIVRLRSFSVVLLFYCAPFIVTAVIWTVSMGFCCRHHVQYKVQIDNNSPPPHTSYVLPTSKGTRAGDERGCSRHQMSPVHLRHSERTCDNITPLRRRSGGEMPCPSLTSIKRSDRGGGGVLVRATTADFTWSPSPRSRQRSDMQHTA